MRLRATLGSTEPEKISLRMDCWPAHQPVSMEWSGVRGVGNVTSKPGVEKALTELQRLIRRPPSDGGERAAMTRRLPLELTGGEVQHRIAA